MTKELEKIFRDIRLLKFRIAHLEMDAREVGGFDTFAAVTKAYDGWCDYD